MGIHRGSIHRIARARPVAVLGPLLVLAMGPIGCEDDGDPEASAAEGEGEEGEGGPVDECAEGTHDCGDNATCIDLGAILNVPGFICDCNPGWADDGEGCADVDECLEGMHNCDLHAVCTNTEGGFTCACRAGYAGDGLGCEQQPLSADSIVTAGRYLAAYQRLREAIAFGAYEEELDIDGDGAVSPFDVVAARCIANAQTEGEFFPEVDPGCPLPTEAQADLFLAIEPSAATECESDDQCQGQAPGTPRCTVADATCRCLPIGRSGFSECQPQYP